MQDFSSNCCSDPLDYISCGLISLLLLWNTEAVKSCAGEGRRGGFPPPHPALVLSLSPLNPLFEPAARCCQWFLSQRTFEMPPVSRLRRFKVWHANDIYSQRLRAGDGNQLLVMPADCLNTWADPSPAPPAPTLARISRKEVKCCISERSYTI